ncbi:UNVERIFIED_CONTAM: hypothetical protein Sradi_5274900 [Sesamum radiatum]|uniref:Reverse transcriptase zinc-binding domain-containing protein n=1 Tax=Sesamum radiatum TaxID=300843 RepID=A0AAW2LLT6_SESRA
MSSYGGGYAVCPPAFGEIRGSLGLTVNLEKSSVVFSRNTPAEVQLELARGLGVRVVPKHEKYLGLPALVGLSKREVFQNLVDRVWMRLNSWKCKNLSQAGPGCSFTWRSIVSAQDLLSAGLRWQVGNGHTVRIWTDKWVPRPWTFKVLTAPNTLERDATVSELLTEEGDWNDELLNSIFQPEDVGATSGVSTCKGTPDLLRWRYEPHGRYSVKSAYHLYCTGTVPTSSFSSAGSSSHKSAGWSFIWSADVPPKVRLFAWRACRDSLPTSSNLARRGVSREGACPWCGTAGEDLFHTLLRCHFARLVWAISNIPWSSVDCTHADLEGWVRGMHQRLGRSEFGRALLICWMLWGARNRLLFQNVSSSAEVLIEKVRSFESALFLDVLEGGLLLSKTRACPVSAFCAEGEG